MGACGKPARICGRFCGLPRHGLGVKGNGAEPLSGHRTHDTHLSLRVPAIPSGLCIAAYHSITGVRMQKKKCEAWIKFTAPSSKKELQTFLGGVIV